MFNEWNENDEIINREMPISMQKKMKDSVQSGWRIMFFQINMLQISATRSNQNNDLNQAKENFTQKQLFNPDNALDSLQQIQYKGSKP